MALLQCLRQPALYSILASLRSTAIRKFGVPMLTNFVPPAGTTFIALPHLHSCHLELGLGSAWDSKRQLWRPHILYHGYCKSLAESTARTISPIRHR
jgi:hypothetical protein